MTPSLRLCILAALALLASACAPSFSPLYRDYEPTGPEAASTRAARLEAALEAADWTLAPSDVDDVVVTEPRTLRHWGLYRVRVHLEAVPMGGDYVRVFFHPYRYYVTGNRSKIPYFKGSLRRALLPELNAALEAQGFRVLGTLRERNEADTAE